MAILRDKYLNDVAPKLKKEFKYSSSMMIPRIDKVVLNMGVNEATQDKKIVDDAINDLELIAGQKPLKTKARKSINQFKLREGQEIGCKVTLRKENMWEFLYKLINSTIPRIRDFKGLEVKGFDGRGNYTLGIKEHVVFPEIDFESVEKVRGLSITVVTTAKTDEECRKLLQFLGMPFKK